MIYYIRHEEFSKSFSSLLNALETVNQTREVQDGIPRNLGTNPYMSPYVETELWGVFSHENIPEVLTGTHKSSFLS